MPCATPSVMRHALCRPILPKLRELPTSLVQSYLPYAQAQCASIELHPTHYHIDMAATKSQLRKRGATAKDDAAAADDAKATKDAPAKTSGKAEGEGKYEIVYKNGKAYRKLRDLPDVGYLITYGLPGQEGKSTRDPTKPWYTDFYLPGILLLIFVASLVAFHHIPFKPRTKPRYSLADIKARKAAQDEQMRRQQQVDFDN